MLPALAHRVSHACIGIHQARHVMPQALQARSLFAALIAVTAISAGSAKDHTPPHASVPVKAIFRDMTAAHPDFKAFHGGGEKNCVEKQLGANNKPVLSGSCSGFTTSENFDQW
jgi:hypothetical protein